MIDFPNIYKKCLATMDEIKVEMRDLFKRGHKYYKVELDNTFPDYILNNQSKFNHWIKQ